MADVTRLLAEIESGDRQSAEMLLPLVYGELRGLAAARLANEKPGQTLQATALVHEAYVRLVGGDAMRDAVRELGASGRFLVPTQTKPAKYCLGCALLEQRKFDEAEPLLRASLLSEEELSYTAEAITNEAVVEALAKLYDATDRPELAKEWREKRK